MRLILTVLLLAGALEAAHGFPNKIADIALSSGPTLSNPYSIALDSAAGKVYVASYYSENIVVVDVASRQAVDEISNSGT